LGADYALLVPRFVAIVLLFTLTLAACSSGPDAPPVDDVDVACSDEFCVAYPVGWEFEVGEGFISFNHPGAPDEALATVGFVNMEAVTTGAGGTWPATTDTVVRSFWALLEEGGLAEFGSLERLTGGAFRSTGSYEDGRLWYLLVPGEGSTAVGLEVRGPNASWEAHADAFFDGLEITGSP